MSEGLTATVEELAAPEAITAAAASLQDQPLPGFEPPPFDHSAALDSIVKANRRADQAKSAWKSSAEQTSNLKKIYDREVDTLSALIRDCAERERGATPRLVQGSLTPVGVAASSCRYEQEEGVPCPGCIALRKAGAPLPDPEDTDHAALVREAFVTADDREELFSILTLDQERNIQRDVVHGWSVDEAREVALYLALNAELPDSANKVATPAVLKTDAEVMDEAKACLCEKPKGKKTCKTCGGAVTGAK
jgi:hypothetical protein